jgi:hypothetical protein
LAIDPGKNALGWAFFGDAGYLYAAGVVRSATPSTPGGDDTAEVARHILRQLLAAISPLPSPVRSLVVEKMKIYPGPQQKGDQNDLIDLAYISGGVHALPPVWNAERVTLVHPHAWKGQVPKKKIMQGRIERSLTELEAKLVRATLQTTPDGLRHNGWDAVGIGLWAQQRLR